MTAPPPGTWRTLLLVACVSAAVLAHEIALLRVLSIAHWHHAAGLVVAVAMLGFGAAATALAVFPRLRSDRVAHRAAALYAVAIPGSLTLASVVDFNALAVGWDAGQWGKLLLLQAVFLLPLFFGALAIQVPLALAGRNVGRVYAVNLAASGVGALGVLPLLFLGAPETVLRIVAALAAVGALSRAPKMAAVGLAAALFWPLSPLAMSRYKPLSLALLQPDVQKIETRHRPTGRIDLVRAPALRSVSGLSLTSRARIPAQTVVYVDGLEAGALLDGPADYFGDTLAAAPAALFDAPRVLVLGGAGDVEETFFGPDRVRRADAAWTGENPRAVLERETADLVLLRVPPSVALRENGLATEEALRAALAAVGEDGVVCAITSVHTPPREEVRLVATARAATEYVLGVRALDEFAVLARPRAWTDAERDRLDAFANSRGFDRIGSGTEFHAVDDDAVARALAGEAVVSRYRTDAATDDRPFFHRALRWDRVAADVSEARGLGAGHVDWGTLVALAAAVQVTLLSLFLVLLPLVRLRRDAVPVRERRFALLHFLAIGLAYALIEMAFLGRLTIALGSAEYAAGAVLCAFLLGSGLGSLTNGGIRKGALAAALLALAALPLLGTVRSLPAALALSAVVAFPMGMPFPAGLRRLDLRAASLVPWALAVNACASVAAFAAAPIVASDLGFTGLVFVGAALYFAVAANR